MYAMDDEEFDLFYEIYDRYRGEETPMGDKLAKAGEWLEQHHREWLEQQHRTQTPNTDTNTAETRDSTRL